MLYINDQTFQINKIYDLLQKKKYYIIFRKIVVL